MFVTACVRDSAGPTVGVLVGCPRIAWIFFGWWWVSGREQVLLQPPSPDGCACGRVLGVTVVRGGVAAPEDCDSDGFKLAGAGG